MLLQFFVCLFSSTTVIHAAVFRDELFRIANFSKVYKGKVFNNHVIKTAQVSSRMDCVLQCLSVEPCVSYNYQETSTTGSHTCELNNNTFDRSKVEDFQARDGFEYGESNIQSYQDGPCATSICKNDGKCVNVDEKVYECLCPAPTLGNYCEQWKGNAKDYTLTFPRKSTEDVISPVSLNSNQVSKLTTCAWVNYVTAGWHTFFSYSASNTANMLAMRCHNIGKCEILVNAVPSEVYTSPLNDGTWHHFCFSWDNNQGILKFYVDGAIRSTEKAVANSLVINGTGKLIIGQLQSSPIALEFNSSHSFMGKMHGFNMWDAVKLPSEVLSLSKQCMSDPGNLVDWRIFAVLDSSGLVNRAMPSTCAFNVSKTANFEPTAGEKYINMPFTTSLREATICFWSRRKWRHKSTPFCYYSETTTFVLRWTFIGATQNNIYAAGSKTKVYFSPFYDDSWHHFCYSWESTDGRLVVYVDGIVMYNATSVEMAKPIEETGVLVIGQRHVGINPLVLSSDSYYSNYLTDFNIWNTSLSGHVIAAMSKAAGRDLGNELNWNDAVYGGEVLGGLSLTPTSNVTNARNPDFYLDFGPTGSTSNYVEFENPIPSVSQFLACYWLWTNTAGGVFGYSTPSEADEWAAYIYTDGAEFCIHNLWQRVSIVNTFTSGWSFMCWRWRNTDGMLEFYKDGQRLMSMTGYRTGYTIPGGGYFVLGQELDSHQGGFDASQAFTDYLSHLNIWDQYDADPLAFEEMARGASYFEGNIVPWSSLRSKIYGTISVVESSSCTLADFLTQELRNKWCKKNISPESGCSGLYSLFDRAVSNSYGKVLRCYCMVCLFQNSTGHYRYNSESSSPMYYSYDSSLRVIRNP